MNRENPMQRSFVIRVNPYSAAVAYVLPLVAALGCSSDNTGDTSDPSVSAVPTDAESGDDSRTPNDDSSGSPDDASNGADTGGSTDTGGGTDSTDPVPVPEGARGTCGSDGEVTGDEMARIDLDPSYYLVAAPESAASPLPLVLRLHGDGTGVGPVTTSWLPVWRNRRDFVLVAPLVPNDEGSWRGSDQATSHQFLHDVIEDIASRYDIDVERVYVVGYSGGSTFLGWYGFTFTDIFAAIAFHCGGWSLENHHPVSPECRTPSRFVFGEGDFLRPQAENLAQSLEQAGHEVEWVEAGCTGHCCGDQIALAADTLDWFLGVAKCGGGAEPGCGAVTDLP